MSDIDDHDLTRAVQKIDLLLKRRQAFWETPRNLVLIIGAVAAISGLVGFKLGNAPTRIELASPLVIHLEHP